MTLSNSCQLLLAVMVWVFSLQGFWRRCLVQGCLEEERNALLQLKAYFNYPNGTSLSSWGGNHTDCCEWDGVGCHGNTIGRVDSLVLFQERAKGIETGKEWFLNASLFIPFKELNDLNLDGNGISGCVENGGFEKLSQLSNLVGLSLSDNKLNNSILLSLGSISSLRFLYLAGNRLSGTINMKELNNLTNLVYLSLERNKIEDFKSLQEVLNLNKLEFLELGFNALNSSVLSSSIKYLDIFDNQLQGSFDMKELDSLINLVELDLSANKIRTFVSSRGFNELRRLVLQNVSTNSSSIVLQSLGAFPFLENLDLSENNFEGRQIFHQDSQSLMKLEELWLDFSTLDEKSLENLGATLPSLKDFSLRYLRKPLSFQGHISFFQTVGTMTTLEKLDLSESNLNGTLPATQGLCNLKNLRELDLSSAGLSGTLPVCLFNLTHLESLKMGYNNLSGALSQSLANLTSLQLLDLSYNHLLRGEFPTWLLENNRELRDIHLDGCSFSGPLRLPNQPHLNLSGFDISHNRFHGHIPEEVGIIFPSLRDFAMSNNTFHGRLPSSLGNMTSLASLDLSGNSLSGEIPGSLAFACSSLSYLILSNNNLDGQIFSSGVNYQRLGFLFLDGNQFTGTIPDSLSNLSSTLAYMDLSRNRITGHMPVWMGNMSSLVYLDLSRNDISGSLPYRFSPCALEVVSLSSNKLEGSLASTFYGCSKLVALDLGHNYFTGTIPRGIGSLPQLSYLILRANNLEGDIPLQLCKLKKLTFIDLSHNNLSGHVLPCLRCTSNEGYSSLLNLELLTKKEFYLYNGQILRNMSGIDVSFNNLTGRIPPEIGNLTDLKVLNLSFNGLTGQIPTTFSNLKQVESLDLSHNKLAGNIPPELSELNFLAVFSVAYNNLTGKIPDSRQFATFENSSYEGNPFLCGSPLTKPCFSPEPPPSFQKTPTDSDEEGGFMDIVAFKVSFLVAYFMVMLAIASVLYINPQWRRAWFYFIGVIINKCYYFLVDNLPVPSRFRYWQPCN